MHNRFVGTTVLILIENGLGSQLRLATARRRGGSARASGLDNLNSLDSDGALAATARGRARAGGATAGGTDLRSNPLLRAARAGLDTAAAASVVGGEGGNGGQGGGTARGGTTAGGSQDGGTARGGTTAGGSQDGDLLLSSNEGNKGQDNSSKQGSTHGE